MPDAPVHIGDDEIIALTNACWPTIKVEEAKKGNDGMATFGQLCATFGAAMQQQATSPDRIAYALNHAGGIYAGWYGVENPSPAPEPPPLPALESLYVAAGNRWTNVDLRGTTAFGWLGYLLKEGPIAAESWLRRVVVGNRFNEIHVCATLPPGAYWGSRECGPHQGARFWAAVDTAMAIAGGLGVYINWIIYGALEPWGGVWDPISRRDIFTGDVKRGAEAFAYEFVERLRPHAGKSYNLANEPDQIGLRDSFGELVRIGTRCREIDPQALFSFGSPTSGARDLGMLLTRKAQIHSTHLERLSLAGIQEGWVTTKRSGDDPSIDQSIAVYRHDENWNYGEGPQYYGRPARNDFDTSPASAFCAAAHSRCRQHLLSFHWDGGLFCDDPGPITLECMQAHHRGLDAIPRLVGSKWRGHHPQSFVQRAPFADDDAPDRVLDHVRRGNLWRVVGTHTHAATILEHRDFDLRRYGAGRVVDRIVTRDFAAGVYVP